MNHQGKFSDALKLQEKKQRMVIQKKRRISHKRSHNQNKRRKSANVAFYTYNNYHEICYQFLSHYTVADHV